MTQNSDREKTSKGNPGTRLGMLSKGGRPNDAKNRQGKCLKGPSKR